MKRRGKTFIWFVVAVLLITQSIGNMSASVRLTMDCPNPAGSNAHCASAVAPVIALVDTHAVEKLLPCCCCKKPAAMEKAACHMKAMPAQAISPACAVTVSTVARLVAIVPSQQKWMLGTRPSLAPPPVYYNSLSKIAVSPRCHLDYVCALSQNVHSFVHGLRAPPAV